MSQEKLQLTGVVWSAAFDGAPLFPGLVSRSWQTAASAIGCVESEVWRFCDLVFIKGCFVWVLPLLISTRRAEPVWWGTGEGVQDFQVWLKGPDTSSLLQTAEGIPYCPTCSFFICTDNFGSNSVVCCISSSVVVCWVVLCKWILSHTLFGPNKSIKYIQC